MNFGITFAHTWVLFLLLLPAALLVLEVLRVWFGFGVKIALPVDRLGPTARRGTREIDGTTSDNPTPGAGSAARKAKAGILRAMLTVSTLVPVLVLAVVVLILAGPKKLGPPQQEKVLTNIEFLLDVSGSMMSPLGGGGATRNTASLEAIRYFLDKREGDAFGLTIFGDEVAKWVPLTKDHRAIASSIPFLDPSKMPSVLGGTRVGFALRYAIKVLSNVGREDQDKLITHDDDAKAAGEAATLRPGGSPAAPDKNGDRLIILITDGFSYDLDGGAATTIGNELLAAGILVHAIHVGEGQPPGQLTEVVSPTGGRVFAATDPSSFSGIFDAISGMAPVRMTAKQPEPVDCFWPFAYTAAALLAVHGFCLFGLRITPW